MNKSCVPYPRKALYLSLTIPMLVMYVAIAALLWQISPIAFTIYCGLFVIVAFAQSYVCVYWKCPYVGKFGPCVGGFCLPSSQLARLFAHTRKSKRAYDTAINLAFASFLGIIVLPMYFLYLLSLSALLGYLAIVLAYAAGFLWMICPVCATRHVCPGGQTAMKLHSLVTGKLR